MFEKILLGLRDPLKRTNVQKIHLVFFFLLSLKQEIHIENEECSECSQEPFGVEEEEGRGSQQQGIENDGRGQV